MTHKPFIVCAQGIIDYTLEAIPVKFLAGKEMCICTKEAAIYVTREQVKKFFGLIDPKDVSIRLITDDNLGSQFIEPEAIETEDDGSTTIVVKAWRE